MRGFYKVMALVGVSVLSGAAFGQIINEDFKMLPDFPGNQDWFGYSVAVDDGIVVVGSLLADQYGLESGSVYLFDADTGEQIMRLTQPGVEWGEAFGHCVAIDNGIIAVGGYANDVRGDHAGTAYLFDAATGAPLFQLFASDGQAFDQFGWSIDIKDGLVVVGANLDDHFGIDSGSAYVFDATTGVQLAKIASNDGQNNDEFGHSVAIGSGRIAVGAWHDDDNGFNSGSAYLFNSSNFNQYAKLVPNDGAVNDEFGNSIANDGNLVAVGSWRDDNFGNDSGSVYTFYGPNGGQIGKIVPEDSETLDWFGRSVAISNGKIAVGTYAGINGPTTSSVYVFDGGTRAQLAQLRPSDGGQLFGSAVGLDNGVVVAGAFGDNENGILAGAAYLFDTNCAADLTGDGDLNFLDVSAFLAAFGSQDPVADFTGEGDFNFLDVSAFLSAFGAGCP